MKPLSVTASNFDRSPIRAMLDAAAAYPDAIHLELGSPISTLHTSSGCKGRP